MLWMILMIILISWMLSMMGDVSNPEFLEDHRSVVTSNSRSIANTGEILRSDSPDGF